MDNIKHFVCTSDEETRKKLLAEGLVEIKNSNGVYSYQSLKNILFSPTIISLYKDVFKNSKDNSVFYCQARTIHHQAKERVYDRLFFLLSRSRPV